MAATLESSAATAVTVTMVVTVATLVGTAAAAVTVALQVRTAAVTNIQLTPGATLERAGGLIFSSLKGLPITFTARKEPDA